VSGTPFGTAGYAVTEETAGFPGSLLMQSLNPDWMMVYWLRPYGHKLMENLDSIMRGDIFHLAGGFLGLLFFAGLMLGLRTSAARRLRYFTLMCLAVLIVVEALGKTHLSVNSPEVTTENLLALLTPLVAIFGTGAFFQLVDQMNLPSLAVLLGSRLLLAVIVWWALVSTIILKAPLTNFPPYYPPDIQRISGWMRPDELMMSDIPWAVAWYGHRQCSWTTTNSKYEFFQLNDYIKPVRGLYLSQNVIDGKILSECLGGSPDNWSQFAYELLQPQLRNPIDDLGKITLDNPAAGQSTMQSTVDDLEKINVDNIRTIKYPTSFPLNNSPYRTISSGMFITDHKRW
jgi:hypothetical protein